MSRMVRIPTTNASAFYGGFLSANDSAASFGLNPPSGQKDKRRFQARQRHTPGDGVYLVKGCENLLFAIIKKRWQGTSIFLKQGPCSCFCHNPPGSRYNYLHPDNYTAKVFGAGE